MKKRTLDEAIEYYLHKRNLIGEKQVRRRIRTSTIKKNCLYCKKEFVGGGDRKLFCKQSCYFKYRNEEYQKNNPKPTVKKICLHCGKEFETFRVGKEYCTKECRSDMWRKIHHDKYAIAFGVKSD